MHARRSALQVSAAAFLPQRRTISALRKAAKECQGCPLYRNAIQTVFGAGARTADGGNRCRAAADRRLSWRHGGPEPVGLRVSDHARAGPIARIGVGPGSDGYVSSVSRFAGSRAGTARSIAGTVGERFEAGRPNPGEKPAAADLTDRVARIRYAASARRIFQYFSRRRRKCLGFSA